jgi:hypothetical protein
MAEASVSEVVNNVEAGRFEISRPEGMGYAEYRRLATGLLFPHTEVPVALEGQGIGSTLVKAAMAYAREAGLKVIPVCTFFAGYIARHPEHHDLVHPDYRAALGI